jgi:hypothetical protein
MSSRRLACFLLGIWLGASFLMTWVVTNPPVNDRLLARWVTLHLIFGAGFFLFLLLGSKEGKSALALVLLMLVAQAAPVLIPAAEVRPSYVLWELVKGGSGLVLALQLVRRRRGRSGDAREDFDMVDKSNHRHINR